MKTNLNLNRFRESIYTELNNKTMKFTICNVIRKVTDRTKKVKGILKEEVLLDTHVLYVLINDKRYEINLNTLYLKQGKGYVFHKGIFVNFIGLKGTTYNDRSLFKYKPEDTVKGIIINNIFNIK